MTTSNVVSSEGNTKSVPPEPHKKLNIELIKKLCGAGDTLYARKTILLTDEPRVKRA